MKKFQEISPYDMSGNMISTIGKEWMLVSAAMPEGEIFGRNYNTMTASWGGVGFLWGRPVAFIFVRPERHTYSFTERSKYISLSFFTEKYKEVLNICGSTSGQDTNKVEKCSLTPVFEPAEEGRHVYFEEASRVLLTRKLYAEEFKRAAFLDPTCLENYRNSGFHKMYVCEIEKVLEK